MIGNLNEVEKRKYIVALKGTWFENELKKEGREEEKIRVVENLLKIGLTNEQIALAVDLPIKKVIELKNK